MTESQQVREISGLTPDSIPYEDLLEAGAPAVLRGVAKDWPLVKKGERSAADAVSYLKTFDAGRKVTGYVGAPEMKGRYFYNDDLTGPNYKAVTVGLGEFLDEIVDAGGGAGANHCYIGSTDVDTFLPGMRAENDLTLSHPMFGRSPMLVSIWIGNRTTAAAHYDMSNNIACNLVGRRRFTLFPPEQVHNLYPGPLEPTPGGQVVSMVDFSAPDLERFPRFSRALEAAQVVELSPGDALFSGPLVASG